MTKIKDMNTTYDGKIIIIGNGFDVANGYSTRYSDFIGSIFDDLKSKKGVTNRGLNENVFYKNQIAFTFDYSSKIFKIDSSKHLFLAEVFKEYENKLWVDIETKYFETLLQYSAYQDDEIDIINDDLEILKNLFQDYLSDKIEKNIGTQKSTIYNEFYNILEKHAPGNGKHSKHRYLINFNYTSKELLKYKELFSNGKKIINIHGQLNNSDNPIVFGYGDDDSEEYKKLTKRKNDALLKNFKTFHYARTSNYIQVLGILEKYENIYIQIIGHSCGASDKTMLKTIFQHPNVAKIEYLYHKDESRFFKNLYSLSRIFDDTALMRKKIIPLKATEMIPQKKSQPDVIPAEAGIQSNKE